MIQNTNVDSPMTPKKTWTQPVIKVISLNSAKNGGPAQINDATQSSS